MSPIRHITERVSFESAGTAIAGLLYRPEYPVNHFAMYHGAVRDRVAADQLAFLRYHLLGDAS